MSGRERAGTLSVFTLWLVVFAGGILVDTRPSRLLISPEGVAAFEAPRRAASGNASPVIGPADSVALAEFATTRGPERAGRLVAAWAIIILWFLPTNLALLCAVAGTLGAFGNRANLQDDGAPHGPLDASNPYVSALLRGFCVYLVMISGLLLLDDDPFSNPSPGQYIRLAGFLSLFSFVVNYNPQVFGRVVGFAVKSIEAKASTREAAPAQQTTYAHSTIEVATVRTSAAPDSPVAPLAPTLAAATHDQDIAVEDANPRAFPDAPMGDGHAGEVERGRPGR